MDHFDREEYEENEFPLAYLITFRTYGTWLHGDVRGSVGRNGKNVYGSPLIPANEGLKKKMIDLSKASPVVLTTEMRSTVEAAINEISTRRGHNLYAVNARTNHVHTVIGGQQYPERIAVDLKANATKMLRDELLIDPNKVVWVRGQSRRYLWKHRQVDAAIDYTLYSQGLLPFEFER
jgi:REP element-mobilizing transposase RayT